MKLSFVAYEFTQVHILCLSCKWYFIYKNLWEYRKFYSSIIATLYDSVYRCLNDVICLVGMLLNNSVITRILLPVLVCIYYKWLNSRRSLNIGSYHFTDFLYPDIEVDDVKLTRFTEMFRTRFIIIAH